MNSNNMIKTPVPQQHNEEALKEVNDAGSRAHSQSRHANIKTYYWSVQVKKHHFIMLKWRAVHMYFMHMHTTIIKQNLMLNRARLV